MDTATSDLTRLKQQIRQIATQRDRLLTLSKNPTLGTLSIDVTQAIEELDDLLAEFYAAFPEEAPTPEPINS